MWTLDDEQIAIQIIEHNLKITGTNPHEFMILYYNFIDFLEINKTDYELAQYMRILKDLFPFIQ